MTGVEKFGIPYNLIHPNFLIRVFVAQVSEWKNNNFDVQSNTRWLATAGLGGREALGCSQVKINLKESRTNTILCSARLKQYTDCDCLWLVINVTIANQGLAQGTQACRGGDLKELSPFIKIFDNYGGFSPPSKNLSLFHLLSCDQTITIKRACLVMTIFPQFVVYQLTSSLTKILNSNYQ